MTIKAYIKSTGHYLPERIVDNQFFVDHFASTDTPTSDEWISERTGIKRRHWAAEDESSADLAAHAAQQALDAASLKIDDIDLVVIGTATPERIIPSTACFVLDKLGASKHIPGFDLTAACSGFQYSAATAAQFVQSGAYKNVLVIGVETLSRIVDMTNRGSCILFGDGAGAVVVSSEGEHEIIDFKMFADGSKVEIITQKLGSRYPATPENIADGVQHLTIEGREVYKVVVNLLPKVVEESVVGGGYTMEDLDWVLPHQMNLRIIEAAAKRLGLSVDQFLVNIQDTGNTSSASVPVLMDQANRSGKIKKGDLISIVVFGGGFTWGSMLVRW